MTTKFTICIFAVSLVSAIVFSQKKSTVKNFKIKTTTVYTEEIENGKVKQIKESFTRFDALGQTIEEAEYDKKGREKSHIYYDYDLDGNKIRETFLKSNGAKEKVIEYKYENDLKVEKSVLFGNGAIKSRKKYVYELEK